MLSFESLVYLLTIATNAFLALFVFFKNRCSRIHRLFAIFVMQVVGWIFTLLLYYEIDDPFLVLFLGRLNFVFGGLIPYFAYQFSIYFPYYREESGNRRFNLILAMEVFFLCGVTLLTPAVVVAEIVKGERRITEFGPLYVLFILHFCIYLGSALLTLFRKFREADGSSKLQLKFVFWGFVAASFFGAVLALVVPILFNAFSLQDTWLYYVLQNLSPLSTVFLFIFISYAILKHRLMDIRVAVRAGLFRLMMIVLLGLAFVGAVNLYRSLGIPASRDPLVLRTVALTMAFLVAVLYRPLEVALKSMTDKLLFQREYSYQELLRNLGKVMAQSVDLEEILSRVESTLKEVMKVSYVGFAVRRGKLELEVTGKEKAGRRSQLLLRGFEEAGYLWAADDLLFEQIRFGPKIIVTDELSRVISESVELPQRARLEEVVDELKKLKAGVVAPLPSKEGIIGLMILGEKKSEEAFTVQDIQALESLVYQAGVSIENAALLAEVKTFNERLREEIAVATRDLALKNKNLSVLRKLDKIIINTIDFKEMAQKLADVVTWEMGYLGALVCGLDEDKDRLNALAISDSPAFKKITKILPNAVSSYSLDMSVDPSNLLVRSIRERKPFYSANLADFLTPALNKKVTQIIQRAAKIVHAVCYPLSSKGHPLGCILIAIPQELDELTLADKELLLGFVEESGIALENAKMYSDLIEINEKLTRANRRLKELDEMKDELISIASHELNTPMSAIKSYVYMALHKEKDRNSDKAAEYLQIAYDASERMIRLINDMLSVSRIDSGRLTVNLQLGDLAGVIRKVLLDLQIEADKRGVRLEFNAPAKLPQVWMDKDRINEVLFNLVGNAIKFSFPQGKVKILAKEDGEMVQVAIIDQGPGIPKKDIPRLFRKFSRLQHSFATMAETQGGTGLGLYISKGIVDLHGGKIGVKSKKGKGSIFFFTLRAVKE